MLFSSLTHGATELQETHVGVSSLMDVWMLLTLRKGRGGRHRQVAVLKARGIAHSSRVFGFTLTERGFQVAASEG